VVKLESAQDPHPPTGEVVEVVSEGTIAMVGEAEKEEVEVATENEVVEGKPVGEQIGTDVESNNLAGSSSTPRRSSLRFLAYAT
jgi:hypothetical protein